MAPGELHGSGFVHGEEKRMAEPVVTTVRRDGSSVSYKPKQSFKARMLHKKSSFRAKFYIHCVSIN